jgi:tRNA(fMet)-specific endonuclease VapC
VTYLLDTNTWIAYLRQRDARLLQKMQQVNPADIRLCTVVLAELFYGAFHSAPQHLASNLALVRRLQQQFACLGFDEKAAEEYGRIRAELAASGNVIGPHDLMIAAIAKSNRLTLVTHNTAEFSRVTGLTIEDWQA